MIRSPRGRCGELPWLLATARCALVAVSCAAALLPNARDAAAADYYVGGGSPQCTDQGQGTRNNPYCSISTALAAHHQSGTTIHVLPGIYREQVTVNWSGDQDHPLVLLAEGSPTGPVVIDGADDFSDPSLWTPYGDSVWVARSVNWAAAQVQVDSIPLVAGSSPDSLGPGEFVCVPDSGLFVNVGGPNPGTHTVEVGRRPYGFYVSHRAWVRIQGFLVASADNRGVMVTNGSSNVEFLSNTIRRSRLPAIQVNGCTAIRLAGNTLADNGDHGISLTNSTGCTIEGNESTRNAAAASDRGAGIYVYSSSGNRILRNRFHDNLKAGEDFESNSNDNVSVENFSWNNGLGGYNHRDASGTIHNGDVAFGNNGDGFALLNAPRTSIYNCVAVVNGLKHSRFDLAVDTTSTVGFASDDNVIWNPSGTEPIRYMGVPYSHVSDFASVSGTDAASIENDPRFVDPRAGDFHPLPGSPLIDSADSGTPGWLSADAAGLARVDDPSQPNRGRGPIPYADRGALEYDAALWSPAVADTVPRLDHVIVIVMENKPYDLVRTAPYTASLGTRYSSFANSYSYQHQSQSDYYALWSAVGRGVSESICPAVGSPYDTENLGHLCETQGVSWRAYSEGLPAAGDTVCAKGLYARRHCPWTDWGNLDHSNERPYTDLAVDIAAGTLPKLAFVIPNLCNDTHNQCGQDTILIGDNWLAANVPAMIEAVGPRGVVILTWDEDDGTDGNHILTTFASPLAKPGYLSERYVNHFVVIRTLCDALGLPPFAEAANVDPITDVWIGQSPPHPDPPPPPVIPTSVALGPAYPNPFRGSVSVVLRLPDQQPVSAAIYDLSGRRVRSLLDETKNGDVQISWDGAEDGGRRAAAGVYLLRVRAGGASFQRKLIMMGTPGR